MQMTVEQIIGTALYETHGAVCEELVNAGYDLQDYYDAGGLKYGDFSKVYIKLALVRGAKSYQDYVDFFHSVKQESDKLASKQLFARVSGIYTPRVNRTQTDRTRSYRRRLKDELDALREATAKAWIEHNLDEAKDFIAKLTGKK